jgi:SAM-dependent methyltransferase
MPQCKLCGQATDPYITRNSYQIVRCRQCGFMFSLLPQEYSAEELYADDSYFERTNERGEPLWRQGITLSSLYLPRLRRIAGFQSPGRLLDVGCGAGDFLAAAQRLGWRVAGVELSPTMRQMAANAVGCPVYGSIEELMARGDRFECVTIFEVIEHTADPFSVMRQINSLIKPGGIIALSTPNCECREALDNDPLNLWFNPPEHISYFGPRSLQLCLEHTGLRLLALEGLEGYWRAVAGDTALPRWIAALLGPFRKGKRMRPGGLLGRILKARYDPSARIDLYRRPAGSPLAGLDVLEAYARKPL